LSVKQLAIFDKLLSDGDENIPADNNGYMTKMNTPISSKAYRNIEINDSSVTDKSQDKGMYIS